ncbi:hypothetical protein E2C01_013379 [Portunus trituberculatus]|uniref:Uncharacterized protein n=1 Tax=Portunus trituberculatus TaxID=210409 RepID=A0A5B7DGY3_PORTR|nr:hypothetical protein [Portunus trituberculatus]
MRKYNSSSRWLKEARVEPGRLRYTRILINSLQEATTNENSYFLKMRESRQAGQTDSSRQCRPFSILCEFHACLSDEALS